MSNEPRSFRNRLENAARRVSRTLKSSVCMGTKRITNSNLGTAVTQCGKFQRFKEIYQDYRRDPNTEVAHIVRNVDGARRLFDIVIKSPFSATSETASQYVARIQEFIEQAKGQKQTLQQDIAFIPDTPEYGQLKDELRNFIPFMFNYYVYVLENLIPIGVNSYNNTESNNGSRRGSNLGSANSIPNWKGGKRRTRRRSRR